MRQRLLPFAATALMVGTTASADPFVDAVVRNFQEMGYQFIEIERGRTQLKAEGVRGTEEFEVIYDLATGRIISRETGSADGRYVGRSGVEVSSRDRDFLGGDRSGRGDDDEDDDDLDDDNDDDDDDYDDDDRGDSDDDDEDEDDDDSSRDDSDDDNDDNDEDDDDDDDDDDSSGSSDRDDNDDDED